MTELPPPSYAARLVRWSLEDHGIRPQEVTCHAVDAAGEPAEAWRADRLNLSVRFITSSRPVEYGQQIAGTVAEVLGKLGAQVTSAGLSATIRSSHHYMVMGQVHGPLDYEPCLPADRAPLVVMGKPAPAERIGRRQVYCSECGQPIDSLGGSNVRMHGICSKILADQQKELAAELS